ncbi:NACHT domain-containing protein [uncultured Paraglaciecola sp.]|uniref:NACHT domain-containing protein n=1 Tax=uncultured Paraglaciecola sp. TaxID=1765024 RepID=UPI0025983705|nr:NACHT domain-containing protein [uncultured Paraglaciecola sp.]
MNTVKKGDELRDKVFRLCVAAGMKDVDREHSVGGKSADVYFEHSTGFEGIRRYAIECKNYRKPLGEPIWNEIYAGYYSRKTEFDKLLVISEHGITENFRKAVELHKDWVSHYTWQQFLFSLIDFKNYFQSLSYLNKDEALNQYYIPPKTTAGNDIEKEVIQWVNGKSNQPLAFLAGYGMGKSSLAKHLASTLAPLFIEAQFPRIPVYIRLGDLFNQQDINSLIITYFASEHQVGGMSPTLFKEMNRLGLLLIIFDGFDEMKHGMTERDFKRIFTEIKKLVDGDSRVMVLGRPSALASDSDRAVLFGSKESKSVVDAIRDEVVFKEVTIAEFDDSQLEKFVNHYLDLLNIKRTENGKIELTQETIEQRAEEVLLEQFKELIRRPVHAEMLCKIAIAYPEQALTQTSRYQLYQSFVSLFLDREAGKQAREAIEESQRLSFMKDVAWHFWPDKGHQGFTINQVKSSSIAMPEKERPSDDIYREMLIGSLIEQKDENLYFFAHRSFQEYLVAEFIINIPRFNRNIDKLNTKLSIEIVSFINDSGYLDEVAIKLFDALPELNNTMSIDLKRVFDLVESKKLIKYIESVPLANLNSKQYFLYAQLQYGVYSSFLDYSKIPSILLKASALCGWFFQGASLPRRFFGLEMRIIAGLTLMLIKPLVDKANIGKDKIRSQIVLRDKDEIVAAIAIKYLTVKYTKDNEFESLEFDVNGLFNELNTELSLLDVYMLHGNGSMSLNGLDQLLMEAFKSMKDEIKGNDRRHIEYRRALVKFFRSDKANMFVVDKTSELAPKATKSHNSILSLKRND